MVLDAVSHPQKILFDSISFYISLLVCPFIPLSICMTICPSIRLSHKLKYCKILFFSEIPQERGNLLCVQLNFAIPDPTVPEVRQYRTGVVGPDFFSFISFLILSNNTEFAINGKFGNNR